MAARGTELIPLNQEGVKEISDILMNSRIYYNGENRLDFTRLGTFEVSGNLLPPRWTSHTLWSRALMQFDPDFCWLRGGRRDGELLVYKRRYDFLTAIHPAEIRLVDETQSYVGTVTRTGLILPGGNYGLVALPYPDRVYAYVDPSLIGKDFHVLVFFPLLNVPANGRLNKRDCVVIDPHSRNLVKREVSQPLPV